MAEVFDFGLQQHKIKMDGKFFENNLFAVAGDTVRRLEVQLLDSNNMVQNTTGISLRLNAVVAGQATYAEATLVDATKGLYKLDLPNGMLIAPGNWQFQWQIIGVNGEKLHSFAFTGSIGSNLSEGGTEATNFYINAEELKQMQDDLINGTFNSEVLETNIAEKLNNLEEQYAPKLTEVTAQLAQTATKNEVANQIATKTDKLYVDTQIQSVVNGSPKGGYATLAALKSAYPTGNINIYVVSADGKWYYWNNLDWVAGGVYQGLILQDNGVTSPKLEKQYNYHGLLNNTNDLNTVMKTGVYWILNGSQPTNTPLKLVGKIYILRNEVFNSSYVLQTAFRYDNPSESYSRRIYIGSASSITPWKKNSGGYQGILTNTTDLDIVNLDDGTYWIINNNQPINTPSALINKIYVLTQEGFGDSYAIQTAYNYDEPSEKHVRRIYYTNGTKTAWKRIGSNGNTQRLLGEDLVVIGHSIPYGATSTNHYQDKIAEITGANIITHAVSGSKIALRADVTTHNEYSLYNRSLVLDLTGKKNVFFDYGVNDWNNSIPIGTIAGDEYTIQGALFKGITNFLTRFPQLKIMATLPMQCFTYDGVSEVDITTKKNAQGNTLLDVLKAIAEVYDYFGIPYYDAFHNDGINKINHSVYLTDMIHPNNYGNDHIGIKRAHFINQQV